MPSSKSKDPYSFDEYLNWRRSFDYYRDDPYLQKVVRHFSGSEWDQVDREAREISSAASFRWRDFADEIARPEHRPYIVHYDAYHHRIDRIVRPLETETMEKEVFSKGLFSDKTIPWARLVKMYLIYQNGEACISCPLTCTEGLVALLERYAGREETESILDHCKNGVNGDFAIGAQYLSEIQGGSDVAANRLEAVADGDIWRLYGNKFFCSATHADYAVVTAKPQEHDEIALFVVPSWLPGNKEKEIRNGYTIDRIKWKLGTSELTTAEITFDGAVAYQVGELDKGIANVVSLVLSYSRLTVGLSSAASMTRAAREAKKYGEFRTAFGTPIGDFPMLARQIRHIERAAQCTTAGAFKLYQQHLAIDAALKEGNPNADLEDLKKRQFDVRELIMLQKVVSASDAVDSLRTAISVFGGHGAMEDFSSLPRLLRDALINELWEGPRNVLISQIHKDCQRASDWYSPKEFVERNLPGYDRSIIKELGEQMSELVSYPDFLQNDDETMDVCEKWVGFCEKFFHSYQDHAYSGVN